MNPIFSIIIDCDAKGNMEVWSQQKERLSPENMEKLSCMLVSVKKAANQYAIHNELPFSKIKKSLHEKEA
jgi:hypothetical protein